MKKIFGRRCVMRKTLASHHRPAAVTCCDARVRCHWLEAEMIRHAVRGSGIGMHDDEAGDLGSRGGSPSRLGLEVGKWAM